MGAVAKTMRFTLGLTVGAGLGAAAALLLAPQSGQVSKEQVQERLDEIMRAGRSARQERERELLEYWEQTTEANKRNREEDKDKK